MGVSWLAPYCDAGGWGEFCPPHSVLGVLQVAVVLRGYGQDRETQVRALILGLAFQALMVGAIWALGKSLRLGTPPALLAVVAPLVSVATLVPISVAGFGVREAAFIALLAEVGVTSADATLLSSLSVAAASIALAAARGPSPWCFGMSRSEVRSGTLGSS